MKTLINRSNEQKIKKELEEFIQINEEVRIDDILPFLFELIGDYPTYKEVDLYLEDLKNKGKIERLENFVRYIGEEELVALTPYFGEKYNAVIILSINTKNGTRVSLPRYIDKEIEHIKEKLKEQNISKFQLKTYFIEESETLNAKIEISDELYVVVNITNNLITIESTWKPKEKNLVVTYVNDVVGTFGTDYRELMTLVPLSYAMILMNVLEEFFSQETFLNKSIRMEIDKIAYRG
ncbi:MAG: hypothetical protein ACTSYH_15105 [Candidatus Heimdallarchaeaceae archaeon]